MREQVKKAISDRLATKLRNRMISDVAWGWEQVKQSMAVLSDAEKAEIIRLLSRTGPVRRKIKALADAEADTMLANNSLDIDELKRILTR